MFACSNGESLELAALLRGSGDVLAGLTDLHLFVLLK